MPTDHVELKHIAPLRVAAIRGIVPNYQSAGQLYRPLMQALKRHGLTPSGPRISLYYDEGYTARDVDMEAAVPVAEGTLPAGADARIRELPGGLMASVIHRGPYDDFTPAYQALMAGSRRTATASPAPTARSTTRARATAWSRRITSPRFSFRW